MMAMRNVMNKLKTNVNYKRRVTSISIKPTDKIKKSYMLFHPQYNIEKAKVIIPSHRKPLGIRDNLSYGAVYGTRSFFDLFTGYSNERTLSREQWLNRFIYLETVAGVPGMIGGMMRHMISLRSLKRDYGWIHTLLEEAENERMHLLTFVELRQPGPFFRLAVLVTQGVFFNTFLAAYIITPRTCHRFVGYLEEEAVKTYSHAIRDIDTVGSDASIWAGEQAPQIAINYWNLPYNASIRDVIMAVRADEASHSHVNHTLASMALDQQNPFEKGHYDLPQDFVQPPEAFFPYYERKALSKEHDTALSKEHDEAKY
jgi:threonyl-tRNA synthetase